MTLKKMNERSAKETRKVVGIKKDATLMRIIALPIPMCTHQHHREKREYPYPLFIQDSETHHHKNQPLLLQGRQAKGGNTKDKRDLSQGWQRTTTFQDQATIFKKLKQKEEEADSFISPA